MYISTSISVTQCDELLLLATNSHAAYKFLEDLETSMTMIMINHDLILIRVSIY